MKRIRPGGKKSREIDIKIHQNYKNFIFFKEMFCSIHMNNRIIIATTKIISNYIFDKKKSWNFFNYLQFTTKEVISDTFLEQKNKW